MNIELERVDNMDPIPGTQGTSARYSHFNMTRRCALQLRRSGSQRDLVTLPCCTRRRGPPSQCSLCGAPARRSLHSCSLSIFSNMAIDLLYRSWLYSDSIASFQVGIRGIGRGQQAPAPSLTIFVFWTPSSFSNPALPSSFNDPALPSSINPASGSVFW
jgi:hypothetical protein